MIFGVFARHFFFLVSVFLVCAVDVQCMYNSERVCALVSGVLTRKGIC